MACRTHHTHAIRNTEHYKLERWEADSKWAGKVRGLSGETWCGQRHGYNTMSDYKEGEDVFAFSRRSTNCPGCSAAIGKAILKQQNGRVTLERVTVPKGRYGSYYRTAWQISIDGTPYGTTVMQNGWGNPWELKDLVGPDHIDGADFGRTVSHEPSRNYPAKSEDLWQHVHFASKEMMAIAALRCRERGEALFTVEERKEFGRAETERRRIDKEERDAASARYAAESARKAALRAERKELAYETVKAALGAATTNAEIAGFMAAIDIITGKDVQ